MDEPRFWIIGLFNNLILPIFFLNDRKSKQAFVSIMDMYDSDVNYRNN